MLAPDALTGLIDATRNDVLSVAADIDPAKPEHQDEPPAWLIWLRTTLSALVDGLQPSDRRTVRTLADRVLAFVEHERPRGRGLAIFAAPDLWRTHILPVPLRGRVTYGRPDVLPLLWAADEYEPYAVLAVNKERARLLVAYLGAATVVEDDVLELDPGTWRFTSGRPPTFIRRAGMAASRGIQRDTFEARVEEHHRRLWRAAAEAAAQWLQETRVERLIIAGPEEAASETRRLLPEAARQRLIAVVAAPPDLDTVEIHRATQPVALREERARELALVDDILTRATGRAGAVVGPAAVVGALAKKNVLVLAADRDVAGDVLTCEACGHVTVPPADRCPACGGALQRGSFGQMLPLLARRAAARLELVDGEAAARLRLHGGVGARLRYSVL
ncbi:MAG TPA: VLRF1 family aeRF1-type release factor [bacterium]|nr:VLRF1 family aeRF1-type release factor [bacterium]